MAIIVKDELLRCIEDKGFVSSRIMWVRLKFGRERWVFVSAYGPGMEKDEKERDGFWEDLQECLGSFSQRDKIVVLGDLNAKVGDTPIDGIVGMYGVAGVNSNGASLIQVCAEKGLSIGNTYFKKRDIHKYTWRSRGNVSRSLIDYVLIGRDQRGRLLDVNVLRGATGPEFDHYLVEGKLKVRGFYRAREGAREGKKIIKVSELRKEEKQKEFQDKIREKWEAVRGVEIGSVEEEWQLFKKAVLEAGEGVCGTRMLGRKNRRKGSEWWCEEIRALIENKNEAERRDEREGTEESGRALRVAKNTLKAAIRERKEMASNQWGRRISDNFRENKKMFWKEVNEARKANEIISESVKDKNGRVVSGKEDVRNRWKEYFGELLNVEDDRVAELTIFGRSGINSRRRKEFGAITREEIRQALAKMKGGKAPGMDGVDAEFMKVGGDVMIEWLERLFNVCWREGRVPQEWREACIVPIYKGKGEKNECANYRGISLLSIPGKLYGRVIIERVIECTEEQLSEEQGGFRRGRGCVDQVFALRSIVEKYLEKKREVYVAFMDLEKAYDRVDREAMWRVLQMYGVNGRLIEAIKGFYLESKCCVRVDGKESDMFDVKVGLRQGCVMSPWLFNLYMDGVVREVNARVCERGVELVNVGEVNQRMEVEQLLFADDAALVADSKEKLVRLIREFERVCNRRKLKINVGKSKVMRCSALGGNEPLNISLNGELLEEVNEFKYLGSMVASGGGMDAEVRERLSAGGKVMGGLASMWKCRGMSIEAKMCMWESIVVPTVLYGSESWVLSAEERHRVNVFDMRCLRRVLGVSVMDRVRNVDIRRVCGNKMSLTDRADRNMLKWFGHIERMEGNRLTKKIYTSKVEGNRGRGRPKRRWRDAVRDVLFQRGLDMQEGERRARDRGDWKVFVYGGRRAMNAPDPPI